MDNAVFALPIKNYSNPISRVRKIDGFKARARRQKANIEGTLAEGIRLVILHKNSIFVPISSRGDKLVESYR